MPAPSPASDLEPAKLSVVGAVATLRLDRPDRRNAIDCAMAACLRGHAEALATREDLRVLVIEGSGEAFCAGGDVQLFAEHADDPSGVIRSLLDDHHEFLILLQTMPKAVLLKLHGVVAGAGLSLVGMGDLAVASEETRFVPAYGKLGVSPDGGGTIGVAAALGRKRSLQIFLAEDSFTAADAAAWGLVNAVVPLPDLDRTVAELAARLARNAPAALAATKRLIGLPEAELRARLEAERDELLGCVGTEVFRDAVRRFAGRA